MVARAFPKDTRALVYTSKVSKKTYLLLKQLLNQTIKDQIYY